MADTEQGVQPDQIEGAMYDFYRSKSEPDERMAVLKGADLPNHVDADDWELITGITVRSPEAYVDVKKDIAKRGFSYFKLV
jgi:hypothetical protein